MKAVDARWDPTDLEPQPKKNNLLCFFVLLVSIMTSKGAHIDTFNKTQLQKEAIEKERGNETVIKIEALQREKDDLFKQINKAIDAVIPELEKSNITEKHAGVQQVKILKQQLKQIHEAESDDEGKPDTQEKSLDSNNSDFRRKFVIKVGRDQLSHDLFSRAKKKKDDFIEDMVQINNRYTSLPMITNRQKIAKQIEDWLKKTHEERRKKKAYQAKIKVDKEKCPDFGRGKNKRGKEKGLNIYPCCRKCCKKSYLGCL